ncbi:hypothetical protein DRO27_04610 [Candidatus Bathyarchaeota archaeon]|nr:MAG: hypothetical protein DRO27_04610 [Candidatus Bathyarchaeota archaeon]
MKVGWEGIDKKIEPSDPLTENIYELTPAQMKEKGVKYMPEHLGDAVDVFAEDRTMKEALGEFLFDNLIELKREEFQSYMDFTGIEWAASRPKITSWEYERYLTRC